MSDAELRAKLYELMDAFMVESKDQHGNERSLDRLNRDRHLFVDNTMQLFTAHLQAAVKEAFEDIKISSITDLHRPLNVPAKQPWTEQAVLGMINIFNERIAVQPTHPVDGELREEIIKIYGRLGGREITHKDVAKHSHWSPEELQSVLIEDHEIFYHELEQLFTAHLQAAVKEAARDTLHMLGYNLSDDIDRVQTVVEKFGLTPKEQE